MKIDAIVKKQELPVQFRDIKILIVDDSEDSMLLLYRIISPQCRETLTATNGLEAVEACQNNQDIDIILMDIKMPVMDGLESIEKIRQFNKDVIIIAQTAYTDDRHKIISVGGNDYITKPIKRKDFFSLINKYFK